MTRSILARVTGVLSRVTGTGDAIWLPRQPAKMTDAYDLWYGASRVVTPRHDARHLCCNNHNDEASSLTR